MKTSEVLIKAKAVIDTPDKWAQGALARNKFGGLTMPKCSDACKFCSVGAVVRVMEEYADRSKVLALLSDEARLLGYDSAVFYNDAPSTTHYRIMELFDKAITKALELEQRNENI